MNFLAKSDPALSELKGDDATEQLLANRLSLSLFGFLVCMKSPDPNIKRFITLEDETAIIGRSAHCSIPLEDRSISRQHARIQLMTGADPYFLIFDLGSGNGTLVNGEAITQQRLRDGDLIILGETELVFKQISLKSAD